MLEIVIWTVILLLHCKKHISVSIIFTWLSKDLCYAYSAKYKLIPFFQNTIDIENIMKIHVE